MKWHSYALFCGSILMYERYQFQCELLHMFLKLIEKDFSYLVFNATNLKTNIQRCFTI